MSNFFLAESSLAINNPQDIKVKNIISEGIKGDDFEISGTKLIVGTNPDTISHNCYLDTTPINNGERINYLQLRDKSISSNTYLDIRKINAVGEFEMVLFDPNVANTNPTVMTIEHDYNTKLRFKRDGGNNAEIEWDNTNLDIAINAIDNLRLTQTGTEFKVNPSNRIASGSGSLADNLYTITQDAGTIVSKSALSYKWMRIGDRTHCSIYGTVLFDASISNQFIVKIPQLDGSTSDFTATTDVIGQGSSVNAINEIEQTIGVAQGNIGTDEIWITFTSAGSNSAGSYTLASTTHGFSANFIAENNL